MPKNKYDFKKFKQTLFAKWKMLSNFNMVRLWEEILLRQKTFKIFSAKGWICRISYITTKREYKRSKYDELEDSFNKELYLPTDWILNFFYFFILTCIVSTYTHVPNTDINWMIVIFIYMQPGVKRRRRENKYSKIWIEMYHKLPSKPRTKNIYWFCWWLRIFIKLYSRFFFCVLFLCVLGKGKILSKMNIKYNVEHNVEGGKCMRFWYVRLHYNKRLPSKKFNVDWLWLYNKE